MPPAPQKEAAQLVEAVDTVLDGHREDVIEVLSVSAEEPPFVPHS